MKVLHVITSLRTGGAERLVLDLTAKMREAGIETDIAVFDGTQTPLMDEARKREINPIILGTGYRSMYDPRHVIRLGKIIGKYDLVNTHNYTPQIFTALASGRRGKPVIVTTEHNTDNRRRGNMLFRIPDHIMYRRYDSVICCSEPVRSNMADYLGTQEKMVTIANGINLTPFLTIPENSGHNGRKNILMVAAFRPQKDHLTALRALSLLPAEVGMTFAGEGETMDAVKAEASRLGLDNRVTFAGNITDIPGACREADAMLLSTRYEGLSLSSIEAMASGRPFVATDVNGITENTGDGALLVPPGSPREMAEALRLTLYDPGFARSLGEKGRRQAQRFDISTTTKLYISHYQTLLAK